MEAPDFKKNWNTWKQKIKIEHPEITDTDLEYHPGKEADLVLRLAEKTRRTKEEIYNWLHLMG